MQQKLNDPSFSISTSSWSEWKKDHLKIMSAKPRAKNASYTPDSTQNVNQLSLPPAASQNMYSINSYFDFNPQLGTFVPYQLENQSTVQEVDKKL